MRKYLFFFFLLFIGFAAAAQKGTISVRVADENSHAALEYVTISVFKQGATTPLNGGLTDSKGTFILKNLDFGEYAITIDFIGYQQLTKDHILLSSSTPIVNMDSLVLSPSTKQLKEVVVSAKANAVTTKLDKVVYNPAGDIAAQGGTATDVLKKVPMVSVDIDGQLTLLGSPNIRFLINGKPSSVFGNSVSDALQSIPASQIKNIEIISNPGARYDLMGSGGIINIILKDNRLQGINGSVNVAASNRAATNSLNLNYKKNKLGMNAYFGDNEQYNNQAPFVRTNTSTSQLATTFHNVQNGTNDLRRSSYQTGLNAEYSFNQQNMLTASFGVHHFANTNSNNQYQVQQLLDARQQVIQKQLSDRYSITKLGQQTYDWSLNYKKTFRRENQELNVLYTSSAGTNTGSVVQTEMYRMPVLPNSGLMSQNPGKDRETEISVDYVQPVSKNGLIETGAKFIMEKIRNSVTNDTLLSDGSYNRNRFQSYSFNYSRRIYAGYVSGSFSLDKWVDVKAGLRYEYTRNRADFPNTDIPSYATLAPSFVAVHKIDESQSIKVSYSLRIERPDYGELNPFYNISDPHNISTGNPSLKVELGRNLQLIYNKDFKGGANFTATAIVRRNTQDIQNFTTFYPQFTIGQVVYDNVSLITRRNLGSESGLGANLFGTLPLGNLTLRSNVFVVRRSTTADFGKGDTTVSGWIYKGNLNASYRFKHNLSAEVFGNYNSSIRGIQSYTTSYFYYSIALKKQLFHNNFSIGIIANNPFNNYVSQTITTNLATGKIYNYRQVPFRTIGITLSYKFGKLGFGKKTQVEELPSTMDNTP